MIKPSPFLALSGLFAVLVPVAGTAGEEGEKPPQKEEKKLPGRQDNPSDHYFYGYLEWKDGERYEKTDPQRSWLLYRSAIRRFLGIKKQWPDWKTDIVEFRITRSQEQLAEFETRMGWKEATEKEADRERLGE